MTTVIRYFSSPSYAAVQLCLHSAGAMQRIETLETLYSCGFPAKIKLFSDSSYSVAHKSRKSLIYKDFASYAAMPPPIGGLTLLHSCQRAPRSGRANSGHKPLCVTSSPCRLCNTFLCGRRNNDFVTPPGREGTQCLYRP